MKTFKYCSDPDTGQPETGSAVLDTPIDIVEKNGGSTLISTQSEPLPVVLDTPIDIIAKDGGSAAREPDQK